MSIIPSALILLLALSGFLGQVDFQIPEEWTFDCRAIDESGRLLVSCSRWNTDLHIFEVIILAAGESVDTIRINDERITSLSSIYPVSDGGYLVTCPESIREFRTAAACLTQSGAVERFTSTGLELETGAGNSNVYGELPGRGLVIGGNIYLDYGTESYRIVLMDGQGSITNELEGEPGEEVDAVMVEDDGILLAGEMPGSDQTQAFARHFNLDGELNWEFCCDPGMFAGFDCAAYADDDYLLGGNCTPCDGPMSGLLVRVDGSGNEIWRSIILPDSGYQQVYLLSLMQIDDGMVLASGFSVADNAPRNTDDALIVLLDSDGLELERQTFGILGQNHEEFFGIYQDAEGEVSVYCLGRGEAYDPRRYFNIDL